MRYRVLGEVVLLPEEGPARPLRRRRERTVIAVLLAARGTPVTAERLLAEVWGESSGGSLGSLQVAVSRLRTDLEPDRSPRAAPRLLVSTGGGYALVAGAGDVDAWRFEALAAQALDAGSPAEGLPPGEEALTLWAGTPYGDCDSDLLARERDRLAELRVSLLERRAEDLLALGRHRDALAVAGDTLAESPYRERLWATLALAHYQGGRQAEALATLRELRARLADVLGGDPSPDVQELEQRLLRQDPSLLAVERPTPVVVPPSAAVPAPADRTVGRDDERQRTERLLEEVRSRGGVRYVAVSGEPGIGKSRFVADLVRLAAQRGIRAEVGRTPDTEVAPPLWPWLRVVRALAPDAPPDPLLAPLLEDRPTEDTGAGTRLRLYDAVVGLLVTTARRTGGLVVVLEDLHRADATSLHLVAHLATTAAEDAPLLVVVTRRTTDAATAEEPLAQALSALARAGAEHLRLEGLDADAVGELLDGLLGAHDPRLAVRVAMATAGNPFYVAEYGRLLAALPDLTTVDLERLPVPDGVRDVIAQRLGRLPREVRLVLGQAAVVGDPLDPGLVAAVTGQPEEEVLDALDLAVASGLLVGQGPGYGFAHALTREVLLTDLSDARRLRLHARTLAVLEAIDRDPSADVVGTLASHALAAAALGGEHRGAALRWVPRAARLAAGRQAHPEALQLWAQVAELADPGGADHVAARQGQARALLRLGRSAASRAVVQELVAQAVSRGDWAAVAESAAISIGAGVWPWREHGGKDEAYIADLTAALEHAHGVDEARLCATLMTEHHLGFDRGLTTSYGERASAAAHAAGDRDLADQVLYLRVVAETGRRRPGDREARLALVEELLERRPGGELEVAALLHHAWTLFELGRVAESDAAAARCARAATALRHAGVDVPLAWWRAARARDTGDERAGALADEALRLHLESDIVGAEEATCVHAVATRSEGQLLGDDVVATARRRGLPTQAVVAWGLVESGQPERAPDLVPDLVPDVVEDYAALAGACLQLGVLAALGKEGRVGQLVDRLRPHADDVVTYGVLDHLGVVGHFLALGLAALGRTEEALGLARSALERNGQLGVGPWRRRSEALVARLERQSGAGRPA